MPHCQSVQAARLKRSSCDLQRLHSASLPPVQRLHPAFCIDAWSRPVGRIGGDLLAVWPVDGSRLVAVLGDVMGHGMPAALVASAVRSTLHHLRQDGVCRPIELLGRINQVVLDLFPDYFVTACACLFDTIGQLHYALAGHPPMLVRNETGQVTSLHCPSLPLGVSAHPEISEHALAFPAGSTVLLYSDGVSDTLVDGPRLGCDLLTGLLRREHSGSATAITRTIRRALRQVDRPREDDCSILVVNRVMDFRPLLPSESDRMR